MPKPAAPAHATHAAPLSAAAPAARSKRCPVAAPPPSAAARGVTASCRPLPASVLASQFAALVRQRLRAEDKRLQVKVSFDCSAVAGEPYELSGLRGHRHGNTLTVLRVRRTDTGFALRALRSTGTATPALGVPGVDVQFFSREFDAHTLDRSLATARLALSATVETKLAPNGKIELPEIVGSDGNALTELRLVDDQQGRAWLTFNGASAEIPGSTPHVLLEIAWESMASWITDRFAARTVEPEDRLMLAEVWTEADARPDWAKDRLLELAATLGSPQLLPSMLPSLDDPDEATRIRAVNALAASSGWDARRDAAGKLRELAEVVADYKRECSVVPE